MVDVKVDLVVTDVETDLAMIDGVFVMEIAAFGISVVDFNVDEHFASDKSTFLVPLTTAEYEAFG